MLELLQKNGTRSGGDYRICFKLKNCLFCPFYPQTCTLWHLINSNATLPKRAIYGEYSIIMGKKWGRFRILSTKMAAGFFIFPRHSETHFEIKNSEYWEFMELEVKVLSLRNLIFSTHLLDLLAKQCALEDIHLYIYRVLFR